MFKCRPLSPTTHYTNVLSRNKEMDGWMDGWMDGKACGTKTTRTHTTDTDGTTQGSFVDRFAICPCADPIKSLFLITSGRERLVESIFLNQNGRSKA